MYAKGVHRFHKENYNSDLVEEISYFDGTTFISKTFYLTFKKGKLPEQALFNKLEICEPPEVMKNLNRLERVLISRRILFKKINIIPKGIFPKTKGSICNIPIDASKVVKVLPQDADSNGVIIVKLKGKLSFKGYVYFQAVCPEAVKLALLYLKDNNPLYKDIDINFNNISSELLNLTEPDTTEEPKNILENSAILKEDESPLDKFRFNSQETLLVLRTPSSEEISIAPG